MFLTQAGFFEFNDLAHVAVLPIHENASIPPWQIPMPGLLQ
jgi:hypothetical protein